MNSRLRPFWQHARTTLMVAAVCSTALSILAPGAFAQSLITRLQGESAGDQFGDAVIVLPDGRVVVGAPGTPAVGGPPAYMSGSLYIYSGTFALGSSPTPTIVRMNDDDVLVNGEKFATVLASVGDVNSDLLPDFVAGMPGKGPFTLSRFGAAYLFNNGTWIELTAPSSLTDESFGATASAAGDFNDDGFDDILVGTNDNDSNRGGRAVLYFGESLTGSPTSMAHSVEIVRGSVSLGAPDFGSALTCIGDLNGDLKDEVLVGSAVEDAVYLFLGRAVATPPLTLDVSNGDYDLRITGVAGERFGAYIDAGGDLDGNGSRDLLVSTQIGSAQKKTYVFYGETLAAAIGGPDLVAANDADVILTGTFPFKGNTVYLGDLDGNGRSDILTNLGDSVREEVAVFLSDASLAPSGPAPQTVSAADLATWMGTFRLQGEGAGTAFGGSNSPGQTAVAGGVDLTADGNDNFVVGDSQWKDVDGAALGSVYVYGSHDFLFQNASIEVRDPGAPTSPVYNGIPRSSATFDYDGDGSADVLVGKLNFDGILLKGNVSEGIFTLRDVTATTFSSGADIPSGGSRAIAVADIENDGDPDLFVAHATSPKLLLYDSATGTFSDSVALLGDDGSSSYAIDSWSASWGDYDRDGWIDLLVARAGGSESPGDITAMAPRLLRNTFGTGGTVFDLITDSGAPGSATVAATSSIWLDVDSDGDLDAFLPTLSSTGTSLLYENLGNGQFTEAWTSHLSPMTSVSSLDAIRAIPPLDGSENGLVFARRNSDSNATNLVVFWNLNGVLLDRTSVLVNPRLEDPLAYTHLADLDQDGFDEVIAQPFGDEITHVFTALSAATAWHDLQGAGIGTSAAGGTTVADFDQDGDADVFLGRTPGLSNGIPNEVFYQGRASFSQGATTTRRLTVQLEGSDGNNRYGVGAEVRVTDFSSFSRTSWVRGGRGRAGQTLPEVSFGLAGITSSLSVIVTWPDGYAQAGAVPAASSGHHIVVLKDDHQPNVVTGTLTYTFDYGAGTLENWVVEWDSDRATPGIRDEVTITPGCSTDDPLVLKVSAGAVSKVTRLANGRYHHKMTSSSSIACHPNCIYEIKSTSGVESWDATSGTYKVKKESLTVNKRISLCIGS